MLDWTKKALLACAHIAAAQTCAATQKFSLQEGDFLFQSLPLGDLVEAIEGASQSPYSHVGLLIKKSDQKWYVREAIGKVIDTPLDEWRSRGRLNHAFDAFRLKSAYRQHIPAMIKASDAFMGRPYDYRYDMDDDKIYCSELLYKAMLNATGLRMGRLQTLSTLKWQPYQKTIEAYEQGPVPLDRAMITPKALSEAIQLKKVFSGYGLSKSHQNAP